jgi:hypothetical protein
MMDGVFWSGDLGFVVDRLHMPARFSDARSIDQPGFAAVLESSRKLPSLGPAPVASWLVARLFQLTRERLRFEPQDRIYNDGGGYSLNFVAFTRELKPAAFFDIHGDSAGVRVWGTCAAEFSPAAILQAFIAAILESPDDLMICRLVTVDTDPPDLEKRRFGKPQVYGWDGNRFLGFRQKPATSEIDRL